MPIQTYLPQAYGFQAPSQDERTRFRTTVDEIPALAGTLAQLELLLNAPSVDLEAVVRLVRSDLGLSIQTLRQSRFEAAASEQPWRISDCVIYLGSRMLDVVQPLRCGVGDRRLAYAKAEAFWKHARLVGCVSERTATYFQELGIDPEQAYLAGLMHNLRRLPDVLASVGSASIRGSFRAKDWVSDCNLPSFINDILEFTKDDCHLTEDSPLSRVVSFSKRWIDLCLPWSDTCMARRSRFKMPLLKLFTLAYTYFPDADVDPFMPLMEILKECTLEQLEGNFGDSFR